MSRRPPSQVIEWNISVLEREAQRARAEIAEITAVIRNPPKDMTDDDLPALLHRKNRLGQVIRRSALMRDWLRSQIAPGAQTGPEWRDHG